MSRLRERKEGLEETPRSIHSRLIEVCIIQLHGGNFENSNTVTDQSCDETIQSSKRLLIITIRCERYIHEEANAADKNSLWQHDQSFSRSEEESSHKLNGSHQPEEIIIQVRWVGFCKQNSVSQPSKCNINIVKHDDDESQGNEQMLFEILSELALSCGFEVNSYPGESLVIVVHKSIIFSLSSQESSPSESMNYVIN